MPWVNNGISMESLKLLRITYGRLTHLTFKATVDQIILDALLPTQDGGNFSDTKIPTLSTREERLSKFKVILIKRTGTLKSRIRTTESTNNGTLSMLTSGRENQVKESLTRSSDFTLKETSMSYLNSQTTDTSI
jgi:hypothetical protein